MKFSKSILSTAVLLSSGLAVASTYNAEIGLKYTDNGISYWGGTIPSEDTSSLQLDGTYFFKGVDTSNNPLAEAAFLQKHSFIYAGHDELDFPEDEFESEDTDAQHIGVGFYIPNSIFYVGAEYRKNEDWNDTVVTLGVRPVDGLLVTTSHNEEAEDYEANIAAKYVTKLAGDTAINLEAGFAQGADDAEDTLSLAADYYFTSFFSVGATLVDQDESTYGIRSRYFFNDSFSINGIVVSSDDADQYSIGAAFRF